MFKRLREELLEIKQRDPAAKSLIEIYFLYPGVKAIRSYKKAHWFFTRGMTNIARFISERAKRKTGIEIHPGAQIGKGVFIDHGVGVVIGETAEIGDNCTIYQGVTLGCTGKEGNRKRHPTIGKNVLIGAGAKVLGPICIGDNARIAAGAVVLSEVPQGATVAGVPSQVVKINDIKNFGQDPGYISNSMSQQFSNINLKIRQIIGTIDKIEENLKNKFND